MRKADITTRAASRLGAHLPALNVKVYNFPGASEVAEHFKCSAEVAEKAARFAWESAQELFWEQVQELAESVLGPCKVYSDGRSGGWLVVHDLPDVDTWNGAMVAKWAKFARLVAEDIKYRCSWDNVRSDIDANGWTVDAGGTTTAQRAESLPPVKWDAFTVHMSGTALDELARYLDGRALAATRLARYVSTRALGKSHADAVKASNRATVALAKALGYSYPERQELSF